MMAWLGAAILVVGFVAVVRLLRLVDKAGQVTRHAKTATAIIRDATLSEEVKEKQLQKHALVLFGLFFILAAGGAAALGLPLAVVWGLEQLGWLSVADVLAVAMSWEFLTATTLLAVLGFYLVRR